MPHPAETDFTEEKINERITAWKNFYELLGVDENASSADLDKAYKSMATMFRLDDQNKSQDIQLLMLVSDAYTTLRDPRIREEYSKQIKDPSIEQQMCLETRQMHGLPTEADDDEDTRMDSPFKARLEYPEYQRVLEKYTDDLKEYLKTFDDRTDFAKLVMEKKPFQKLEKMNKELTRLSKDEGKPPFVVDYQMLAYLWGSLQHDTGSSQQAGKVEEVLSFQQYPAPWIEIISEPAGRESVFIEDRQGPATQTQYGDRIIAARWTDYKDPANGNLIKLHPSFFVESNRKLEKIGERLVGTEAMREFLGNKMAKKLKADASEGREVAASREVRGWWAADDGTETRYPVTYIWAQDVKKVENVFTRTAYYANIGDRKKAITYLHKAGAVFLKDKAERSKPKPGKARGQLLVEPAPPQEPYPWAEKQSLYSSQAAQVQPIQPNQLNSLIQTLRSPGVMEALQALQTLQISQPAQAAQVPQARQQKEKAYNVKKEKQEKKKKELDLLQQQMKILTEKMQIAENVGESEDEDEIVGGEEE